jgi:hypothetical protein
VKYLRRFSLILLLTLALLGYERVMHFFNDGFTPLKLHSNLYLEDQKPMLALSEQEVARILDQPYTYLGKGAEMFCFASEDKKYVLKFCKMSRMNTCEWLLDCPVPSWWKSWRDHKVLRARKKAQYFLKSHSLAFQELRKESGLIAVHLCKNSPLRYKICLIDAMGRRHHISLENAQFLLQYKAEGVLEHLQRLGPTEAASAIEALRALLYKRCCLGIRDADAKILSNFGFLGDEPICFDTGRYERAEELKDEAVARGEVEKILRPLHALK